jgi:hypothetical protein
MFTLARKPRGLTLIKLLYAIKPSTVPQARTPARCRQRGCPVFVEGRAVRSPIVRSQRCISPSGVEG